MIVSWQASCRHIFKQATLFQSPLGWTLLKFRFSQKVLAPFPFSILSVSQLLKSWKSASDLYNKGEDEDEDWDWDDEDWDEDAERAISNTFAGKVHAEAALMYYITTFKV